MDKRKCFEQSPKKTKPLTIRKPKPVSTVFNPEGPDSYDFTEDQLRTLTASSRNISKVKVSQPHEWDHLTESCGCLFNDEKTQRVIACDKLILQDRFIKAELEDHRYTDMDKLLKIAEALDARQYLYPKDDNQKAQLLALWGFAYEVSTSAIASLTDTIVPNY
jgi:hypothetical protein